MPALLETTITDENGPVQEHLFVDPQRSGKSLALIDSHYIDGECLLRGDRNIGLRLLGRHQDQS
jgi:hypothetical protein